MCHGVAANSESLVSETLKFVAQLPPMVNRKERDQVLSYHIFLTYLQTSASGVQVFGMPLTYQVVLSIAVKMIVYVPVALSMLGALVE